MLKQCNLFSNRTPKASSTTYVAQKVVKKISESSKQEIYNKNTPLGAHQLELATASKAGLASKVHSAT